MQLAFLKTINAERAARRAFVFVTDPTSGEQRLIREGDIAADPMRETLEAQMQTGKSGPVQHDGRAWFINVQLPPPRLIAIGAVHISQALAQMAKLIDVDLIVIDPRTAFATPERFPDARVIPEWPQVALDQLGLGLDRFTGIALLSHNPSIDDPALIAALKSECFYVGALGSRKTHAGRLERMRGQGFSEAELKRIHAPIGLDIGAVSPAEIAISIMGEYISSRGQKPLRVCMGTAA